MTPKEYNEIKAPDTALAVRLAVTMGWKVELRGIFETVQVYDLNDNGYQSRFFNPSTDASIPYGLIGRGVTGINQYTQHDAFGARMPSGQWVNNESKTHAIINAYCQADPMGHWAKFIGEK